MSSHDEGDYMEMSGSVYLFFPLFLIKGTLLLLFSKFCELHVIFLFFVYKFSFYFVLRIVGWREISPQPSTSGVSREGSTLACADDIPQFSRQVSICMFNTSLKILYMSSMYGLNILYIFLCPLFFFILYRLPF